MGGLCGGLVLFYHRCTNSGTNWTIPAMCLQQISTRLFRRSFQTCKVKSTDSQFHDWVVYHLDGIFGSVGHRVKIHKITPATGKERVDLEIKDYVVLQKPLQQADRLPPPRTLILDFTLTHTRYDSSHVHTTGHLTNIRRSDGAPELDGALREVARTKIYIIANCILIVHTSYNPFSYRL